MIAKAKMGVLAMVTVMLSACGGGGGDGDGDVFFYDDYGTPIVVWTPKVERRVVNNIPTQIYFFPLKLHQDAVINSYVSRIGTSTITNSTFTGSKSTPSVSAGTWTGKIETNSRYLAATVFEGSSVTPVAAASRWFDASFAGQREADNTFNSTTYYLVSSGLRVGSASETTYKVLDLSSSVILPDLVIAGESGNWLTYRVYTNSTKTTVIGRDVLSYRVVSVGAASANEFTARVEWITSSYSTSNLLLSRQTVTQDLTYNVSTGARTRTIQTLLEDVAGSTTSRIIVSRS